MAAATNHDKHFRNNISLIFMILNFMQLSFCHYVYNFFRKLWAPSFWRTLCEFNSNFLSALPERRALTGLNVRYQSHLSLGFSSYFSSYFKIHNFLFLCTRFILYNSRFIPHGSSYNHICIGCRQFIRLHCPCIVL